MATFSMPIPTDAAALCERDIVGRALPPVASASASATAGPGPVRKLVLTGSSGKPLAFFVQTEGGALPEWVEQTAAACARVLEFEDGWDSYGGRKIRLQVVAHALTTLGRVMPAGLPAPAVVPLGDGGIQLEWHRRQQDLEIVFPASEAAEYLYSHRATEEEREGPVTHLDELAELLRRLL